MAGRVDQVQLVCLSVGCGVSHAHGRGLDGYTFFALEVHAIEELRLHLAIGNCAGNLEQAIRKRGLAVVDVRDNAEVANMVDCHAIKQRCGIMIVTEAPLRCRAFWRTQRK